MRSRFLYRFQNEGSWTWRSVRDQCPNLGVIQRWMSMDWFFSKDDIQLSHFFKRTGGRFSFDNHELDLLCQVPAIKIEEPARQLSAPSLGGTFWQSQHWRLQCIAGIEGQLEPSWLKDQDLWVTRPLSNSVFSEILWYVTAASKTTLIFPGYLRW